MVTVIHAFGILHKVYTLKSVSVYPFEHPRAVRSSARGFNQNPYKPYINKKLNNWRLWPDLLKTVQIYCVWKMWISLQSFTKPEIKLHSR